MPVRIIMAILLDQTLNTRFLNQLQLHIVLIGSTWMPVYHGICSTSDHKTPRHDVTCKNGFAMNAIQHSEHFYWIT